MEEKYEDYFWGEIDILHQKTKRQQASINYLIDIINKFQEACLSFSKNIQSALSKNHEIIEYHSMSIHDLSDKFIKTLGTFNDIFKSASFSIRKEIIEPMIKPNNEAFNKEKEFFNFYNKLRSQYNSAKADTNKYHQKYLKEMATCENSIFNYKKTEQNIFVKEEEKRRSAKNANDYIKSSKQNYPSYWLIQK